jgi:CheY-like chemotaxis protein
VDNTRNTFEVFRLNHIITTEIEIDNILAFTPVFDIIVLDYKMPDKDGMEVAKEILIINPD